MNNTETVKVAEILAGMFVFCTLVWIFWKLGKKNDQKREAITRCKYLHNLLCFSANNSGDASALDIFEEIKSIVVGFPLTPFDFDPGDHDLRQMAVIAYKKAIAQCDKDYHNLLAKISVLMSSPSTREGEDINSLRNGINPILDKITEMQEKLMYFEEKYFPKEENFSNSNTQEQKKSHFRSHFPRYKGGQVAVN